MDNPKVTELKQIATDLLSGMLANPHIYPTVSDEGSQGQQEQTLMILAIELAESLISKVENRLK
ncbi:MAG: hypothetical protein Fur0025_04540 [Oscillatoriaceae cyanobacterium]|uniref:hypothetical protein n=1 Tax=[Phormidium] sp. ETS-05 TaxID=222819 RepID=UPI0018EF2168|nr:hypothetical protein [[Phormidium] sp. ETS-05]